MRKDFEDFWNSVELMHLIEIIFEELKVFRLQTVVWEAGILSN